MAANKTASADASVKFALAAAEMAFNTRGEDVVLLDLRGKSPVTEFFVLITGTSPRQMRTVAEEVGDLGKRMGFRPWQVSGIESARWILVDCVNVVVHVFEHEAREHYDLELLWGDCPRINWRKELGLPEAPPESARVRTRAAAPVEAPFDDEEDADDDSEEGDESELVEVEMTDEDTVVKRVEIEGGGHRRTFPSRVEEREDETEEERAMHVERRGEALEGLEELGEVDGTRRVDRRVDRVRGKVKAKKSAVTRKSVKKVAVKKKPVKKVVAKKKPVKKAVVKKAAKAPVKKKATPAVASKAKKAKGGKRR